MPFDFNKLPDRAKRWWFAQVNPGTGNREKNTKGDIEKSRKRFESLSPSEAAVKKAIDDDRARRANVAELEQQMKDIIEDFRKSEAEKNAKERLTGKKHPKVAPVSPLADRLAEIAQRLGWRDEARKQIRDFGENLVRDPKSEPSRRPGYWIGESPRQRELRLLQQSYPDTHLRRNDPLMRDRLPPEDYANLEPPGPNMTNPFLGRLFVPTESKAPLLQIPMWGNKTYDIEEVKRTVEMPMDWKDPAGSIREGMQQKLSMLKTVLENLRINSKARR